MLLYTVNYSDDVYTNEAQITICHFIDTGLIKHSMMFDCKTLQRPTRTFTRHLMMLGTVVIVAALLNGCLSRIATRGNLPDPDLLATMEEKNATQNEVTQILGSPSTVAMFENETWFYISERTETVAFFEPEVLERKVVVMEFNIAGQLQKVRIIELQDGQDITLVERTTPTLGNESGILEQFIGNLGRFNKN